MLRIVNDKFARWVMTPASADPEHIIAAMRIDARHGSGWQRAFEG